MTIAQEFNKLAVSHGGTADSSGTIAGAIDALNDALAGSDQPAAQTIEEAVKRLGEHIGGGSASGTIEITENGEGIDVAQYAYADVNVSGGGGGTCMVYAVEMADGTPQQPQGTIKVGDTTYASSDTSTVMGMTVYGYELPAGAIIEYRAPTGYTPDTGAGQPCTLFAFPDVAAMQAFLGHSIMEVTMKEAGVGGYVAASAPSDCVGLMLLAISKEQ